MYVYQEKRKFKHVQLNRRYLLLRDAGMTAEGNRRPKVNLNNTLIAN